MNRRKFLKRLLVVPAVAVLGLGSKFVGAEPKKYVFKNLIHATGEHKGKPIEILESPVIVSVDPGAPEGDWSVLCKQFNQEITDGFAVRPSLLRKRV